MFSILKFGQKVLNTVLPKNSPRILEHFYQHGDLKKAKWISLAINKNTIEKSLLTKELEILTADDVYALKIAENKEGFIQQLWQNQQSLAQIQVGPKSPYLGEFNFLIDSLIENEILNFQMEISKNLNPYNFSALEISQDEKALEWMRVSFQILEKAIIESLTNPEFLFQTLLFFGKNPKTENLEIRLIQFNLDIKFVLLENGILRVHIYNDKDLVLGSSKKASLEGDFNFKKREMLDELTKLISVVSSGIKIS